MTLKAMSYVSEMRSNLALLRRSKQVNAGDIRDIAREVDSYLAQRVLIYPQGMRRLGLAPDMTFQDKKQALSLVGSSMPLSDEECEFSEFLESTAS